MKYFIQNYAKVASLSMYIIVCSEMHTKDDPHKPVLR